MEEEGGVTISSESEEDEVVGSWMVTRFFATDMAASSACSGSVSASPKVVPTGCDSPTCSTSDIVASSISSGSDSSL